MTGGDYKNLSAEKNVWLDYVNWRGERRWRQVRPLEGAFHWCEPDEWHKESGWAIFAQDVDKGEWRCFRLTGIKAFSLTEPAEEQMRVLER